ncbi:hypothetical protein DNTS_001440 [Danionella cerebrum]|uniref:Uncharacterized protein n=1 Tax=Danionella cerebrum TaxID=2873325 RepID=A0A553R499_9TELE|nr:hypothetical protein DNTS_001440 [Danionella translucida]
MAPGRSDGMPCEQLPESCCASDQLVSVSPLESASQMSWMGHEESSVTPGKQ